MPSTFIDHPDVILIGSGIMSANLGALLKCLDPQLRIQLYEGSTGHAGLCELSYTPDREPEGTVNVEKAIAIFAQFELSKQFLELRRKNGNDGFPRRFINSVPHLSFVHGEAQVDFLKARHAALTEHPFFREMAFTTDRTTIASWRAGMVIRE